jgi:hypothetical protein
MVKVGALTRRQCRMASRPNTIDINYPIEVAALVGTLNEALDHLDKLGLTEAGARLAMVLDCLTSPSTLPAKIIQPFDHQTTT